MFRRNLLAFLCALSMLPVSASFAKSPTIEDGVLLVGTDSSFAPFEFLAEDGKNFTGFDMDLIRAIGKELGYKVVVQNMGFDATVPALRTGIVDAVIAGMTINEKRKKFVDFSDLSTDLFAFQIFNGFGRCIRRRNHDDQTGGVVRVGEVNELFTLDRKSTRLNSSHTALSRMPSSA